MILIIASLLALSNAVPFEHCFQGGRKILSLPSTEISVPRICIRDDISMIKTEVTSLSQDADATKFKVEAFRKLTVPEWADCRPEKKELGDIMVLEIDSKGLITANMYSCFADCSITIDKENALVEFHTSSFNHYSITGSTTNKGWFKSNAVVSLRHTCENLKIQCGMKHVQIHACFKEHIECKQFLHRTILPGYMAESICHNIEMIILTGFTIAIFCLLSLIMKTYLCYIMLPLFIPISYLYGYLYNKSCKKCSNCGLAYHPFSNCGSHCVCGSKYESSERMKIHRTSGLCPGYKSMRAARVLCKSKACGLIMSVLLSMLILSFVTPIGAECDGMIPIHNLPDMYSNIKAENDMYKILFYILLGITGTSIVLVGGLIVLISKFTHIMMRFFVIKCETCKMFHARDRIIIDDGYSSACGSCTCGCPDDPPMNMYHQTSTICVSPFIIKTLKIISYIALISLLSSCCTVVLGVAANPTEEPIECFNFSDFENCTGLGLYNKLCSENKNLNNAKLKEFLKSSYKFNDVELKILDNTPLTYLDISKKIASTSNLHTRMIMESRYLSKFCKDDKLKEIDSLVGWKATARLNTLKTCKHYGIYKLCKCVFEGTDCNSITGGWIGTYGFTLGSLSNDVIMNDLKQLFLLLDVLLPGNSGPYMLYLLEEGDYLSARNMSTAFMEYYKDENSLKSFFLMITDLLTNLYNSGHQPTPSSKRQVNPRSEVEAIYPESIKQTYFFREESKKLCLEAKFMKCFSKRTLTPVSEDYLLCRKDHGRATTPRERTVHPWSDSIVQMSKSNDVLCYKDKLCGLAFPAIDQEKLTNLKKSDVECRSQNVPRIDGPMNLHIKSCRPTQTGLCNIGGHSFNLNMCPNGLMYIQTARGHHDPAGDIGAICFNPLCGEQFPVHPDSTTDCSFHTPRTIPLQVNVRDAASLEEYAESLKAKIFNSLAVLQYKPTAFMGNFKPTFKSITVSGTDTSTGVDDAYIITDLNALSGSTYGYRVLSKSGDHLLDIILRVKSSNVTSNYVYEYTTGPTINYNSVHSEKCTGRCPELGPKVVAITSPDWMTFSKEGTSSWGCEELGCLAIGEGCVAGACKDIIRPEAEVYKKVDEEENTATICFSTSKESFCKTIKSGEVDIADNIELQYKTVESFKLPTRLFVRDNKLYTGQINGLGEYGKYCGNVQMRNGTTIGTGVPVFDYRCHAMSRKDITIRKCYDNNYSVCSQLEPLSQYDHVYTGLHNIKLDMYNKITGVVTLKIKLGTLNYKQYTEVSTISGRGKCAGCKNCIEGFSCTATIDSDLETTCPIESNCISHLNRIIINTGRESHNFKLNCDNLGSSEHIQIKLCQSQLELTVEEVKTKSVLQVAGLGQQAFVVEKDNRCGTWLCKVYNEGFSFLWEPIKAFFGSYISIFYVSVGIIIFLFLSIYIFIPMLGKLRDALKKNEIEYRKEHKY
ncbi:polyprotein [Tataguine virus]|uniref:Envelopment polyprotein n=1 Tax=Tataguine virus TaxID=1623310 RepID=A0A0D4CYV8_9VIRU|nr:polyprotein [Tataguine virus]AJT55739.1 glycoprotein precursor [Tataguine virus]AKO90179.1 polyprotein [Tataguine virus]